MTTTTRRKGAHPAVASVAPPTGLADELLDQLAAFRPIEVATIETARGESEATITQIVTVAPDGTARSRGEVPVFWMIVREQLRAASDQVPWIAGVLTKAGRAYRLRDLTPAELSLVSAAIDQLSD
jgi:hypothetical protein